MRDMLLKKRSYSVPRRNHKLRSLRSVLLYATVATTCLETILSLTLYHVPLQCFGDATAR